MPEMPIFDQDVVSKVARITIFGHDHGHQNYREKIYYNGSFSRLCHGDETDKGFLVTYIDKDSVEVQQMINELAPVYLSVFLEKIVTEINYETVVKAIKKLKRSVDFLKIKVGKETVLNYATTIELIKDVFSSQYKKGIVIDAPPFAVKDGKAVLLCNSLDTPEFSDDEDEIGGDTNTVSEEYTFLFDSSIHLDQKIKQFIELKHGNKSEVGTVTLDHIRDAISKVVK